MIMENERAEQTISSVRGANSARKREIITCRHCALQTEYRS